MSIERLSQHSTIRFEVRDTGVGISQEHREHIFRPFEQVGEQHHKITGTGLGLAISQQLVRLMGGELCVTSALGQGSTFWFELAVEEARASGEIADMCAYNVIGFQGEMRTILVVDDTSDNLAVIKSMLSSVGFDVIEASNGQDGIDKAITTIPDLVLMDLSMPDMSGFETIRRLRQCHDLKNTEILAVSASVSEEIHQESLNAGADGFLTKPVYFEELLQLVQTHLNLDWVYESPEHNQQMNVKSAKGPLIPPSREELTILYDSIMIGDISRIQKYAKELERRDASFKAFASHIRQFAEEFRLDELQVFLESYLKQ